MTSPMEPGLFFTSSPSHFQRNDPADEVPILVAKARLSKSLNPAVATFLKDPERKRVFLDVFMRHVSLLKCRSQAFEHGHVTVYDKVLLTLTRNGNHFESIAAIEYFCEEHLGIDKFGDATSMEHTLEQSVLLRSLLVQGKMQPSVRRWSRSHLDVT